MELNTINNTDTWGASAARLNENFSKVGTEIEKTRHATTRNKGLFPTLAALQAAVPAPQVGDWAVVGSTIPGPVYSCTAAGTWSDTGETGGGGEINISDSIHSEEITDVTTIL